MTGSKGRVRPSLLVPLAQGRARPQDSNEGGHRVGYDRTIIRQRDRNHQDRWPITKSMAEGKSMLPPSEYPRRKYQNSPATSPYFQPANDAEPNRVRHVIHLPVKVADMGAAMELAATLGNSLAHMPELTRLDITVSDEDARPGEAPRRIYCGSVMADHSRCDQRYMHTPPCGLAHDKAADET